MSDTARHHKQATLKSHSEEQQTEEEQQGSNQTEGSSGPVIYSAADSAVQGVAPGSWTCNSAA